MLALIAPYMSAETLELHHDKHHMAYVTNGNKFIKENNLSEVYYRRYCSKPNIIKIPVFKNLLYSSLNHSFILV